MSVDHSGDIACLYRLDNLHVHHVSSDSPCKVEVNDCLSQPSLCRIGDISSYSCDEPKILVHTASTRIASICPLVLQRDPIHLPSCENVSCVCLPAERILKAHTFLFCANALSVSHLVNIWRPIIARQIFSSRVEAIFPMSRTHMLILVTHFGNNLAMILSWNPKHIINTSVSPDLIITAS